mmetsp:Transcript_20971/g.70412  ORF Transcript_20971/g.70412 Transcript_20971/m.70412 type:complete len:206 (-) Transcript_20971:111-728(-)
MCVPQECLRACGRIPSFRLFRNAISLEQQAALMRQLDPLLRRRKYLARHFDGVISGYRELERPRRWFQEDNRKTLDAMVRTAFDLPDTPPLLPVHVLDLQDGVGGYILPHVDNVQHSGDTIVGLSLLSDAVMRLEHCETKEVADILVEARSLYVMAGEARYEWTHEVLPEVDFGPGPPRPKGRRVVLLMRDMHPDDERRLHSDAQ